MIKILIADDHPVVREGLKQIISETYDMVVAAEANNGQEVMDKVAKDDFDVILLDISMPVRNGLDIIEELKAQKPEMNILVLSIHPEKQYAIRVLKLGASGYLTKDSASDELIQAIRKVAKGRKYITSTLAEELAFELENEREKKPHEILSNREFQVLCMIASGKSTKNISEDLYISEKTVSTYKTRIFQKMRMKNDAELIRYAIKENLVE